MGFSFVDEELILAVGEITTGAGLRILSLFLENLNISCSRRFCLSSTFVTFITVQQVKIRGSTECGVIVQEV